MLKEGLKIVKLLNDSIYRPNPIESSHSQTSDVFHDSTSISVKLSCLNRTLYIIFYIYISISPIITSYIYIYI